MVNQVTVGWLKVLIWLSLCLVWLFCPVLVQAQVKITEVLPAPTQEQVESIELFNEGEQDIDLSGWSVWDVESSSSLIYEFVETEADPILKAGNFLVIEINNKLNNSGDGVILKNLDDEIVDQVEYSNSQSGLSWSFWENDWQWVESSLGEANQADLA